ncbi:hypothetical protein CN1A_38 [Clavibacter phage CN1A]|uniref:Uncharacterized protein n=1 Tax=Clavibacter phage CN1A TaxID=1406793 RepID=U5PX33_9CAUD|nr:hypothetical protein CN1A_38 [Clavibacter phage CN1A]AGY47147.1 hypothetical protein CN1A_38 [Clavibacter phage CN1A]
MNIDEPTDLPAGTRKPWRQLIATMAGFERTLERLTGNSNAGGAGSVYTQSQVDEMFRNLDQRLRVLEPTPGPELGYRPSKW